ncbi:endonuclease/exonuclease/phosphatase family protein [Rubrivirga sp. S365]|uniref:Endonuclease/exonuclease/phosphatase family protein n=1 Tax=Rubrivirga litoralis TaxID=3075598 RepID=A0ABU3BT79_9BACT|nr:MULTISPECIES: endonuclease/exonuclease/phosphatase family protein [unclassified Rubrivirga]MDT0632501.1 endonuclease/exonuclease/phosphatase family protein [Rubrivirga sp. F394]MDT7858001.1 endonuclease/exonuclease/phosphatase family protein [Rubrivirga sp. S365]
MAEVAAPPRRRGPLARTAWALFAVVDAPVALAVAVGLGAAVLPPRPFWWAQLAAVVLPYATLALVALTVVPLAARRWGWALVHLVLIGSVAARALPSGRFAGPEPSPDDLVVTSFNVPQTGPSADVLGDSMAAFVGRIRPDVLALQDSWVFPERFAGDAAVLPAQVSALLDRLPYDLAVPGSLVQYPGRKRVGTSVPLFVRRGGGVEVLDQEPVHVGPPGDAAVSVALRTRLRWQGREAVLYNVHLRSFGEDKPWEDDAVRWDAPRSWVPYLRQYRAVYAGRRADVTDLAERIEAETLPVVVVGDFNSTADNWSYWRLRRAGLGGGVVGPSRLDAFREGGGLVWGRTYRADRPLVRIDFVLADPAFVVTQAETFPVGFSDHRPVRVRLRWRE